MPKKTRYGGELREYIPAGYGDGSGEYADGPGYSVRHNISGGYGL